MSVASMSRQTIGAYLRLSLKNRRKVKLGLQRVKKILFIFKLPAIGVNLSGSSFYTALVSTGFKSGDLAGKYKKRFIFEIRPFSCALGHIC